MLCNSLPGIRQLEPKVPCFSDIQAKWFSQTNCGKPKCKFSYQKYHQQMIYKFVTLTQISTLLLYMQNVPLVTYVEVCQSDHWLQQFIYCLSRTYWAFLEHAEKHKTSPSYICELHLLPVEVLSWWHLLYFTSLNFCNQFFHWQISSPLLYKQNISFTRSTCANLVIVHLLKFKTT